MTTEKEWVRLGGKDGVYLVEGEDYTVDRDAGLLTGGLASYRAYRYYPYSLQRFGDFEWRALPPPRGPGCAAAVT